MAKQKPAESTSKNHARAPIAAAMVEKFREVFGSVEVLHVNENGFVKGEKQPEGAPCITAGDLRTLQEKYAG
jgi:hypothetical protein